MAVSLAAWLLIPAMAKAHCDTMDGPVVADAKTALEKGDITPVMKWVSKDSEAEITQAFNKTLAVRKSGPEAKELADNYFFETLVRVHRAGEGAPYTGLKPSGTEIEPAIAEADKSLESGSVDKLTSEISEAVAAGIKERFQKAMEAKKSAGASVYDGREYVEAYVQYIHYVERLHMDATTSPAHGDEAEAPTGEHQH